MVARDRYGPVRARAPLAVLAVRDPYHGSADLSENRTNVSL